MLRDRAGHPDHDAGVALPDAHVAGARAAAHRRHGDRRRGARRRRHEARRAPCALARAAAAPRRRPADPAHRAVGDAAAARGDRAVRRRRPADRARRRGRREAARPAGRRPGRGHARARIDGADDGRRRAAQPSVNSIWPSIYPALLELVREHRSTIVFVNNRRLAERLALRLNELAEEEVARAHHGSLGARAARRDRGRPEGGADPVPRRDVVARARHRHGRGRSRRAGRVAEVGRARPAAHRPRRPHARRGVEGAHLPEVPRRPARVGGRRAADARGRDRGDADPAQPARRARAADRRASAPRRRSRSPSCTRSCARAYPFADLSRAQLENVLDMLAGRYPSDEFAELRPRIIWDRTAGVVRGREGARRLAVTNAGHDSRPRPLRRVHRRRRRSRRRARRGDGLRGARGPGDHARRVVVAHRGDHARPRARLAGARACRASVPFWKGEGVGRPYELGAAIGKFSRELLGAPKPKATATGSSTTSGSTRSQRRTS